MSPRALEALEAAVLALEVDVEELVQRRTGEPTRRRSSPRPSPPPSDPSSAPELGDPLPERW